jgi:hypothetical protein
MNAAMPERRLATEQISGVMCWGTEEWNLQNHLSLGLDAESGGAGIRTLGCSKNRWEDFDGQGGTGVAKAGATCHTRPRFGWGREAR